jgi:putative ABC transport system permease protein
VHSVDAGLVDVIGFPEQDIVIVPINGWSPDSALFDDLKLRSGRRVGTGNQGQAMVGHVLAANLGKKVGDKIELYLEEFEIVGIFESTNVYNNGAVVVLLDELQRLTGRPGKVTGFLIHAEPGASEEQLTSLAARIKALNPDVNALPTQTFIKSVQQIQMSRAMACVVSAIALLIGSIGMLNTMIMSVFERAKEIGVLRAIGWRKARVVSMVLCEAFLLSLGGAAIGVLCAVVLTRYLSTFPMTASIVQGHISPAVMLQGAIIALLVGVGGAAYPAWWSANLSPLEALHKK